MEDYSYDRSFGFFGAGAISSCESSWPQEFDPEDDILASISPAGALSSDNLDVNINHDAAYVPEISVQPPTRTNTVAVTAYTEELSGSSLDSTLGERQPWNPIGVGNARRGGVQREQVITGTSTSPLPSDAGTSQTSFIDSGFASPNSCERCHFVYRNNSNRTKHILTHTKPHMCPAESCNRHTTGFATPNDLDRHVKCVHKTGLNVWWKCDYPGCHKTSRMHFFDRKDNFIAHIKRRHKELKTSDIEELVNRSQHTPTPTEIQVAVRAKEARPQARGRRSSSKAATSRRRAKSDTASMYSAATPSEQPSLPIDMPTRSVPAPRFQAVGSYSSLDDIVSMGRSTGLVGQRASTEEGKGSDLACRKYSSQRSPNLSSFESNHDLAFTSGSPQETETFSWQAQQQARAPQHVFQALPHQQYSTGNLSFDSALSAQMSYRIDQNDMQRSFDPVHGLQVTQSLHPSANSYPGVQTVNMFNRPRVYSASARPDVSFSQPFDSDAYTSFYESPSSSPINQSYGQAFYGQNLANGFQGMDLDSPFTHQSFEHSDMG